MKKFDFKLEKLLTYKDQLMETERLKLAALNEALKQADDRIQVLKQERENCRRDFESKKAEDTTQAAWQLYFQYDFHLKGQIAYAREEAARIKQRVNDQIEVIKNLKLETKSLEIMKASKLDDYNREVQKKEEQRVEEFVNTTKLMKHAW